MKRVPARWAWLAAVTVWGATAAPAAPATVPPNPRLLNAELLQRGQEVYRDHCAACHGDKGDGKGPGAYGLQPKPRDFTSATFKFRTTPSGSLPTDEDLSRSIRQGILGTSMPAFDLMPERDTLAVVQWLKTFSEDWRNPDKYSPAIPLPSLPEWFRNDAQRTARAAKGKELYVAACQLCHGPSGDGLGESAPNLNDNWGQPIRPADLRQPYIRSGRNLTDIYKVLITGVNGAPMPAFQEGFTDDQRWELVAYIEEMRRAKRGAQSIATTAPATPAPAPAATPAAPAPAATTKPNQPAANPYE